MKIAFIADSILYDTSTGVNGTQVQMHNLAILLSKNGFDISYLCLTKSKDLKDEKYKEISLIRFLHSGSIFNWVKYIRKYFAVLNQIRPEITYCRGRSIFTFIAARWAIKNHKKFIWATNGEDSYKLWKRSSNLWKSKRTTVKKLVLTPYFFIEDLFINYGMKHAHLIISQTKTQQQLVEKKLNKRGILMPSVFLSHNNTLPSKEKIVLWLANLSHGKQAELFIDLVNRIGKVPGWRYIMAGGSNNKEYQNEILTKAIKSDAIEFMGEVTYQKSLELFGKASVFINTSLPDSEGLPNTFIQSWIGGTPVISLHHNPNNWIEEKQLGAFAGGDFNRLYEQTLQFINNNELRNQMSANAKAFAEDKFCSPTLIVSYMQVFSNILSNGKSER